MPELSSVVTETLASYYEEVRDQVHKLVAPLSTEQLWRNPYGYGNSVGHLLLHITGNLNHYIGARIGGTGYVRNRPLEFADTSHRPKEEALSAFDRAIDMVVATIRKQSHADWVAPYSDPTSPHDSNRFSVIQRMAAHASHHAGQMIYLAKELARTRPGARTAD
ncbi:MAG: DinB family protein [Candidatus Acidiferrales bacterium]